MSEFLQQYFLKQYLCIWMKRIVFIILLICSARQIAACDLCGCSAGNYFLGPIPQFSRHFIGLRYSFRSFNTVLGNDPNQFSRDFYQTTELWAGFKIRNRFQVLAFVPYNINRSVTDDGLKENQGLGDVSLIGNYSLLDKKYLTRDTLTAMQQLWIGAGIKMPTGKFAPNANELVSSANSQAGTGSFDFIMSASYLLVVDKWGLTSNLNYKINQQASGFKFGNRLTAAVFAFRSGHIGKSALSPNIGLLYERSDPSELSGINISNTGGYAMLGALGLETKFDKITIGFNWQAPLAQDISDSQTKAGMRGMLHLSYAF
jgi:hypothetical protein